MNHSESYRHHKRAILYRIFEFVKDVIGSEFRHRINQLAKIGIFPKFISKYFTLITQQYGGHVTIWPLPALYDFLHLLDEPTHQRLRYCLVRGATRVYHRMNHIASVLVIERALEKHYHKVTKTKEKPLFLTDNEDVDDYGTIKRKKSSEKVFRNYSFDSLPREIIQYERRSSPSQSDLSNEESKIGVAVSSLKLFQYVDH
jgi:hypothetical protein